jgi:hypothetical protein
MAVRFLPTADRALGSAPMPAGGLRSVAGAEILLRPGFSQADGALDLKRSGCINPHPHPPPSWGREDGENYRGLLGQRLQISPATEMGAGWGGG